MNKETPNLKLHSIIKASIFDWLSRLVNEEKYEVNMNQAAHQVLNSLYKEGILSSQAPGNIRFEELHYHNIPIEIIRLITSIFWDFHLQGILMPFPNWISSGNNGNAIITPYGRDLVTDQSNRIQVHDLDKYLKNFLIDNPPPDPEMFSYIKEAVSVFQSGHLFACVILLGVASERLINVLAEKLRDSLGTSKGTEWFQKKYKGDLANKFKVIKNQLLADYDKELEKERLKEALQSIVELNFETIRHARNDIAHPKGREFTWNEVGGLLHNFVQYFKYLNKIIVLLANNPKE